MKKIFICISVLAICFSASGFMYTQLLTQDDLEYQKYENAQGVTLGSSLESEWPWGSYNRWQCFSVANLIFECADYDYGTLVPSLRLETKSEILYFDVYVEDQLNCQQTLARWRALIEGGNEVCIFAAHMPDVDMGSDEPKKQTLWYINRLKGVGGYWNLFEESLEYRD